MKEIRIQLEVRDFGNGDMNSLKRFLYVNSGTREDNFKLISMTQLSESTLDIDIITSSLDVFEEFAEKNNSCIYVKCIE